MWEHVHRVNWDQDEVVYPSRSSRKISHPSAGHHCLGQNNPDIWTTEVTDIKFHPRNMNSADCFSVSKLRRPLFHSLKYRSSLLPKAYFHLVFLFLWPLKKPLREVIQNTAVPFQGPSCQPPSFYPHRQPSSLFSALTGTQPIVSYWAFLKRYLFKTYQLRFLLYPPPFTFFSPSL